MPPLPADPAAHIAATLKWLHPRGDEVFEIRILGPAKDRGSWEGRVYFGGGKGTVAGWFRDQARVAPALKEIRAAGVYVTLNPCHEGLLGRANEKLKGSPKGTSSDGDMLRLSNLLVDFDPKRPAGISSTDNEHGAAILFAQQVKAQLAAEGWPAPLVGDSGNGAHLLYALPDLENTAENVARVRGVLAALAQRYAPRLQECGIDLDVKNFNPSRISKIYGTLTMKGDPLPVRPHRWSKILDLPPERQQVSGETLANLVVAFPLSQSGGKPGNIRHSSEKKNGRLKVAAYLDHYGREVVKEKEHGRGYLYCLAECVFDSSHIGNEAAIGQTEEGKIFYQCFHNSCKGHTWAEARQIISGNDKLTPFMEGGAAPAKSGGKLRAIEGGKSQGGAPPAEPVTEGLSWSQWGNARRMVRLYGKDLRFNHLNKEWYCWTGQRWGVDNRGEAVRRAKATVESIYNEAREIPWGSDERTKLLKFALKSEASGEIAGMMKLAQSEPGIPILPEQFDADPWIFNCDNGTIDLRTGQLREHRREDLLTCISPVKFDPQAGCPQFEKFLFQIMGDNLNLYDFLFLSLSYTLTGDCREQCFWVLWGSGANGKGTLINLLTEIFGSYWANIAVESILAKDNQSSQIRSDLAALDGPRMVTAAEIDKGRRLSESLVKGLTGQDPITARFLYGKEFTYVPQFKLFIQSNNKPIIRDLTEGMWRRLKLVEFPMNFKKNPDREMGEKLRAEKPGILAMLVRGCLNWLKFGDLAEPDEVKQAVQEYRDQMDPLKEFLEAKCLVDEKLTITAADLYGAYCDWADDNLQKRERLGKRHFGLCLSEKGFRNGKGTGGVRIWRGLGLRTLE